MGIWIMIKRPGEKPVLEEVKADIYKRIPEIIGGRAITELPLGHRELAAYADDEFLIKPGMVHNFHLYEKDGQYVQAVLGPVVFTRSDEAGETVSLTHDDVEELEHQFSIDEDVDEFTLFYKF